jgi:hypothetical protein
VFYSQHVGVRGDRGDGGAWRGGALKDAVSLIRCRNGEQKNGKRTDRGNSSNGGGLPSSRGTGATHSAKGVLPNVYDASETYSSTPSDASDPAQVSEGGKPAGATRTS